MLIFDININDAHQRLDRFILKMLPKATRWLVFKLNRKWKVKVSSDGVTFKKQDNEYKLQAWEKVKLFLSQSEFDVLAQEKKESQVWTGQKLSKEDIIYEDTSLLVVNKNAWLNVHPGDHKTLEVSLIEQVQDYLGDKLNSLTFKPSLVHRIDRDTSGIVLIAKEKNTLVNLMRDFREHKHIKKTYYALVQWAFDTQTGTITKKILRIENAKNENKVQIDEKGDRAVTKYKVISTRNLETKNGPMKVSEVLVEIETWKMHQIRIHMASMGHPILWDDTYGDRSLNHYLCREFWLCRQALHAFRIEFMNYKREKMMQLEARMKPDMKQFLTYLK